MDSKTRCVMDLIPFYAVNHQTQLNFNAVLVQLQRHRRLMFTARRNARIALQALY